MPTLFAETQTPFEWKQIATVINKNITEEATFLATSGGILFRSMDEQRFSMLRCWLPASMFSKYECEKDFRFTVRSDDFAKILGTTEGKELTQMSGSVDEELVMRFDKEEHGIHLIEETTGMDEEAKIGDFDFEAKMSTAVLQGALNKAGIYNETVCFKATKDDLTIFSKGESGHYTISYSFDNELIFVKDEHSFQESLQTSEAWYTNDPVRNMLKLALPKLDKTTFHFSMKKPMRLDFELNSAGGVMQYWIAPRIGTP